MVILRVAQLRLDEEADFSHLLPLVCAGYPNIQGERARECYNQHSQHANLKIKIIPLNSLTIGLTFISVNHHDTPGKKAPLLSPENNTLFRQLDMSFMRVLLSLSTSVTTVCICMFCGL